MVNGQTDVARRRVDSIGVLGFLLVLVTATSSWAAGADAQLGALLSPGRLAKAHAALEGIRNCQNCHEAGQRVLAAKCLACHKPIAERVAARKGVHRNVTTDCVSCHVEHMGVEAELRPFAVRGFDHARETGFALDGQHATVAARCDACHKTRSFLTAPAACAACHSDPHKGTLGPECSRCHTTEAPFKDTLRTFNHSKTAFPLAGAHARVTCTQCHVSSRSYRGLRFAQCSDCHQDPHRQRFGAACSSCHAPDAWRTTRVDHSKTNFPLLGRHGPVACGACHVQPPLTVKPRADTCSACHADPHRGAFKGQDCKACHDESGFKKGAFNHGTTRFALTGRHVQVVCEACHKRATAPASRGAPRTIEFGGLKRECLACHEDVHRGDLGTACESCHSPLTFKVTTFTHAGPRAFYEGSHARVACDSCHAPPVTAPVRTGLPLAARVRFKAAPTACAACHRDVHLGQVGAACERCHAIAVAKFAVAGFSHASTRFPLAGKHEPLACASCHKRESAAFPAGTGSAVRLTGLGVGCVACHRDTHLGQLGTACETCHTPKEFAIPSYRHRNTRLRQFFAGRHLEAACGNCHRPAMRRFPGGQGTAVDYTVDTRCTACHTDVHRGQLGDRCIDCHKP